MANQGKPESRFIGILRTAALIALTVGATGSLGFMFRAGQRTPRLLLIFFTVWVISPFATLLWADIVSKRWPVLIWVTLYCVTLIVALTSLATYGEWINLKPPGSANALLFVAVPPILLIFMTMVVGIAAFISRQFSRRSAGN